MLNPRVDSIAVEACVKAVQMNQDEATRIRQQLDYWVSAGRLSVGIIVSVILATVLITWLL
jgi:hypothetical protein